MNRKKAKLSQKNKKSQVVAIERRQSFSGPIPPPKILA